MSINQYYDVNTCKTSESFTFNLLSEIVPVLEITLNFLKFPKTIWIGGVTLMKIGHVMLRNI